MNDLEAQTLAADIIETWQLTASKRIWREALIPMADHDAARKAYQQLRRNHQARDMSIGMFTDTYRQHRPAQAPPEHPDCDRCNGGWQTIEYIRCFDTALDQLTSLPIDATLDPERHQGARTVTGVRPCTCPAGQDCERTFRHVESAP